MGKNIDRVEHPNTSDNELTPLSISSENICADQNLNLSEEKDKIGSYPINSFVTHENTAIIQKDIVKDEIASVSANKYLSEDKVNEEELVTIKEIITHEDFTKINEKSVLEEITSVKDNQLSGDNVQGESTTTKKKMTLDDSAMNWEGIVMGESASVNTNSHKSGKNV